MLDCLSRGVGEIFVAALLAATGRVRAAGGAPLWPEHTYWQMVGGVLLGIVVLTGLFIMLTVRWYRARRRILLPDGSEG